MTSMWTRAAATAATVGGLLSALGCGNDQASADRGVTGPTSGSTANVGMKDVNAVVPGIAESYSPNYAIDDPKYHAAGGPPSFGTPTGTGFSTGDASHTSGGGSGMQGYNGNGAMGTSWAISDRHPQGAPNPNAPEQKLPEQ